MSYCVECGPNVSVDEDGCCVTCGGNALGEHAVTAVRALAQVRDLKKRIRLARIQIDWLATSEGGHVLRSVQELLSLRKPLSRRTKRTKTP